MAKKDGLRWWQTYSLMALTVGLIALDLRLRVSELWHMILLLAIVLAIVALAYRWSGSAADAPGRSAGQREIGNADGGQPLSFEPDRPWLNPRQVNYLRVMSARAKGDVPREN